MGKTEVHQREHECLVVKLSVPVFISNVEQKFIKIVYVKKLEKLKQEYLLYSIKP